MSEITNNRITGLKTSIHSLRLRIGFFWSYLNKQNKEKFETNHLDKKNIKKDISANKSNFDKKTTISNKKLKNNNKDSFLHEKLNQIDPEYAEKINKNDEVRIIRALEVYEKTGKRMSEVFLDNKKDCLSK